MARILQFQQRTIDATLDAATRLREVHLELQALRGVYAGDNVLAQKSALLEERCQLEAAIKALAEAPPLS